MASVRKCPRCGADNGATRVACYQCGAPLNAAASPPANAPRDRFAAVIRERARVTPQTRQPSTPQPAAAPGSEPAATSHLPEFDGSTGRLRRAMFFYRELHQYIAVGIPLAETLMSMTSRGDRTRRRAAQALSQHVIAGGRLSDAMREFPQLVLAYHVELVRAGETAGILQEVLEQIAADCEAEYKLRRAISVALVPVKILLGLMLVVSPVALVLYPNFAQRSAPTTEMWDMQKILDGYTAKLRTVTLPIVAGLGALWGGWIWASQSRPIAFLQHRLSLSVPIIGGIRKRTAMMRFFGTLGRMLDAGVPIAEAYRCAASATGNRALIRRLTAEGENLYFGRGLVDTLRRLGVVPRYVMDQVATGEAVGALPESVRRIAADYRNEVEASSRSLPAKLQVAAYLIVAPLALGLWFALFMVWKHYTFDAPLKDLFDVP